MHQWASKKYEEIDEFKEQDDVLWIPVNDNFKQDQKTKINPAKQREIKGDLMQFQTADFMHKNKSPDKYDEYLTASSDIT